MVLSLPLPVSALAVASPYTTVLHIELDGGWVAAPCWSGQMTIGTGSLNLVMHNVTDGSGSVHSAFQANYQGIDATSDSGVRYVVQSGTHSVYVVNYDSTLYETDLIVLTRWVAQGSAADFWTSGWVHLTRTPGGDYVAEFSRFEAVCP
jgi:hypothetical protein